MLKSYFHKDFWMRFCLLFALAALYFQVVWIIGLGLDEAHVKYAAYAMSFAAVLCGYFAVKKDILTRTDYIFFGATATVMLMVQLASGHSWGIESIQFLRFYILPFYLSLAIAGILKETQNLSPFSTFLKLMLSIQVLVALVKCYIGVDEFIVGTLSMGGAEQAALISIFGGGVVLPAILFTWKGWRNTAFLSLALLGFYLFGISCEKRVVVVLFWPFAFGISGLFFLMKGAQVKWRVGSRFILKGLLVISLMLATTYTGVKLIPSFFYKEKRDSAISASFILSYVKKYSTRHYDSDFNFKDRSRRDVQISRLNMFYESLVLIFQKSSWRNMLFGYGLSTTDPSKILDKNRSSDRFYELFGLRGSHSTFVKVLVESGIVGALSLAILLGYYFYRLGQGVLLKSRSMPMASSFFLSYFMITIFDFFFYSRISFYYIHFFLLVPIVIQLIIRAEEKQGSL